MGAAMNLFMNLDENVNEESIIRLRVVSEGNEEQIKKCVKLEAKCLTEDNHSLKE
jgi:hypothetical protein